MNEVYGIKKYCHLAPGIVFENEKKLLSFDSQLPVDKAIIELYHALGVNYLKFFKMDNLAKLGILASQVLLKETGLDNTAEKTRTAVILSNASSSLVADSNYQQTINSVDNYFPSPSLFVYTLPNIVIGEICIRYKIFGENIFLVSEYFDASLMVNYVNEMLKSNLYEHCITGWVEANGNSFEAFLCLVERNSKTDLIFDELTLNKLYNRK